MAILPVSTTADFLAAIIASQQDDEIVIAAGVTIEKVYWPKNTSHRLIIRPANRSNPPRMKGIRIDSVSSGGGWPNNQSQKGTWARNLTIDGLRFLPEVLTHVKQSANQPENQWVDIRDTDGRGWAWRVDYRSEGTSSLGENAGQMSLRLGSGCQDIMLINNVFEQAAKGLSINGSVRVKAYFNTFSEICEDGVMIWGCKDCEFRYNLWINSRGVSLPASRAFGWSNPEPVHQDFFQIACNNPGQYVDGLVISDNEMYDNTGRVHGILLNNKLVSDNPGAYAGSHRHRNVTIDNNFFSMTHTTGIQMTNVINLKARRNKIHRITNLNNGKSDTAMVFGSWGAADTVANGRMDNVTVTDNVSRKFKGHDINSSWTVSGNVVTNDIGVLPSTWIEMRKDVAAPGTSRTGAYGEAGETPPPATKPEQLEVGDWSFIDIAANPDIPETFIGVIGIPLGSPAYNATVVHWLSNVYNTRPTSYEGLHSDGTTKLWKMAGGALEPQSKYPGQTSDPIRVSYRLDGYEERSDDSVEALTYTVPLDPEQGSITPVTNTWDWTQVSKVRFRPHEDDLPVGLTDDPLGFEVETIRFRPTAEDPPEGIVIWQEEAYGEVELVGSANVSGMQIPDPTNPNTYAIGDYLLVAAFRSSTTAFISPGGIWTDIDVVSDADRTQAGSLVGTVAAAVPVEDPLSSFTAANGRCLSVSLTGVDTANPILDEASVGTSIGGGGPYDANVPGLTLGGIPTRILLFVCNKASVTYPETAEIGGLNFTRIRNHGGSPRIYFYLSDDIVSEDFLGGTIAGDAGGHAYVFAVAPRPEGG